MSPRSRSGRGANTRKQRASTKQEDNPWQTRWSSASKQKGPAVRFSIWAVALMTAAAVVSLRGLPMMAKEGLTMWFYIGFATLFFLIPGAFVSAELGGMFNTDKGGVYTWVKAAFGSSWGLAAVWLQWIQNVVWYPVVLGFTAAALAYLIGDPNLANSHLFNFAVVLVVYWGATCVALFGEKSYGNWSQTLFILGTVIPGVFLILLALVWIALGHPIELIQPSVTVGSAASASGHQVHPWLPNITGLGDIAFLAGTVLLFAGVEVQGARANLMDNPSREFPEAMILAAMMVFLLFTFGSIAVATVIPIQELSLTAGIMQAYKAALDLFHIGWLVPVAAALLAGGALGQIVTWIGGPSRALLQTAENGEISAVVFRNQLQGSPEAYSYSPGSDRIGAGLFLSDLSQSECGLLLAERDDRCALLGDVSPHVRSGDQAASQPS